MKNVAVGENPARPCGKNDTLIVWEEMEPASECPCDIRAMAGWAGWAGPGCGVVNDPPNNVFVLLDSTDQGSVPLAIVADDTNTGVICRTFNDVNVETLFENLDAVEVAACFDDLDELAFSLGLEGGCAL